jgi:hypothetical protein
MKGNFMVVFDFQFLSPETAPESGFLKITQPFRGITRQVPCLSGFAGIYIDISS